MKNSSFNWICPVCKQLNSFDIYERKEVPYVLSFLPHKSSQYKAKTKCHYCLSLINLNLTSEKTLSPTVSQRVKGSIKCVNSIDCVRTLNLKQCLKNNYALRCMFGIHNLYSGKLSEITSCYCPFTGKKRHDSLDILQHLEINDFHYVNQLCNCTFRVANINDALTLLSEMCCSLRSSRIPYTVQQDFSLLPYTVLNTKDILIYLKVKEDKVEVSLTFIDLEDDNIYIPYFAIRRKREVVKACVNDYLQRFFSYM